MAITETLGSLGGWDVELRDDAPDHVVSQLGFFGHIAVVDGPVDVAAAGDGLLTGARYVGVLRAKDKATGRKLSGSGMVFWLGDEDGKGDVLEAAVTLTNASLATAVGAIINPSISINVGTVHSIAGSYTGKHQFQTRREALTIICDAFGAEFRVNGNGTVDVGTAAQLYNTEAPDTVIVRKVSGSDMGLVALGGDYAVDESVYDYSTRVVLLGQTIGEGDTPDEVFATGTAEAPTLPYLNLYGYPVRIIRTISESGTTTGAVAARAQLQLNRFNRVARSLKVTAEEYETEGNFVVGDNVYVYDPDTGIQNPAIEVGFRGELLHPDVVRASGITWPVVQGMTVAFRTQAGVWLDLTPFVTWETGGHELTVGDLPKSLTRAGDNPIQSRVDAITGTAKIPKAPTNLVLSTFSVESGTGNDTAVIVAEWDAVTQNTDNTTASLAYYEIRSRPTFRAPSWEPGGVSETTTADLPVVSALEYDVAVAAVSSGGKMSDWSESVTIMSAADDTPPPTPSDPVVTSYLGQLRIAWDGLSSVGGPMPPDFNRVDVHVGTTNAFTPSDATLVSSLSTAGVAYATAPYASARYVRLLAIDHTGNESASSAVVSGSTAQVVSADIFDGAVGSSKLADLAVITAKINNLAVNDAKIGNMAVGKLTAGIMSADITVSGRFTTALTGARVEMNSLGLQKFAADNSPLVSITGSEALLTGRYRSGTSGRRIEMGTVGSTGEISFYAPDNAKSFFRSYSDPTEAREGLQLGTTVAGAPGIWNSVFYNQQEWASYHTKIHDFVYQDRWAVAQTTNRGSSYGYRLFMGTGEFALRGGLLGDTNVYWQYEFLTGAVNQRFGSGARYGIGDGFAGQSPSFTLVAQDGFGNVIRSTSTGNGAWFDVRNIFDTAFAGLRGDNFQINSDMRGKTDIVDAAIPAALSQIDAIRPRKYKRKHSGDRPRLDDNGEMVGVIKGEGPDEVGVIAQELPDSIAVNNGDGQEMGYSVGSWLLLLTVAVQQLNAQLTEMKRVKK